jgi:hypothetical protein
MADNSIGNMLSGSRYHTNNFELHDKINLV